MEAIGDLRIILAEARRSRSIRNQEIANAAEAAIDLLESGRNVAAYSNPGYDRLGKAMAKVPVGSSQMRIDRLLEIDPNKQRPLGMKRDEWLDIKGQGQSGYTLLRNAGYSAPEIAALYEFRMYLKR